MVRPHGCSWSWTPPSIPLSDIDVRGNVVATSRTGTAKWKHARASAIARAKQVGQSHCPICGVILDYDVGGSPNSAEADHIVEYAAGGSDHPDNLRIICRRCNQRRGGYLGKQRSSSRQKQPVFVRPTASSAVW
ncbi:HNH endonuclease [Actinomyces sp. MRS3W]|uniref:HNH endonuclease n=1 Tax=Actinomyces sp. MRS3W TaxID=2800796 RepID=UPI003967BD6D